MAQRPKHLKKSNRFPKLAKNSNRVTSDHDANYNCIAYAAGITTQKYWPTFHPDYYWPPNLPKAEHVDSFVKLFESLGYVDTPDGSYAEGVEKIAIYTTTRGVPTHAARQIDQNKWVSKLGDWYDIEHTTTAVSGGDYGEIAIYMQRLKKP